MTKYAYDNYGWYVGQADVERSTPIAPPNCGGLTANWTGTNWVCANYVAPPAPVAPTASYGTKITNLAFMSRFTKEERQAIRAKSKIDVDVEDAWDLMKATTATYVELTDPKIIGGLALIVSKVPELTSARALVVRAVPVTNHLELPAAVRIMYGLPEIPA